MEVLVGPPETPSARQAEAAGFASIKSAPREAQPPKTTPKVGLLKTLDNIKAIEVIKSFTCSRPELFIVLRVGISALKF